jgi:hypothetical protein
MILYFRKRRKEMKKNFFSFYVIVTVIGLTILFLFPARGRTECDQRDLSGNCIPSDSNIKIIMQSEETAVENAVAGQAILKSPWGVTLDTTPTYTWYAVANATWYHIWVNTSTGTLGEKWYTGAEVGCPNGTGVCSLAAPNPLAPGTYTWWIQAWYNAYGPWSDGKPFYVDPNGKNCENISSAGFTACSSSVTYDNTTGWKNRTGGTELCFDAPVHLPVGAQITNVFLDYYDSNATEDVSLVLMDLNSAGGGTVYFSAYSSGTPGYGRLEGNFFIPNNIIVDNNGHSYSVRVNLGATNWSNRFLGATICHKPSP